MKMKSELVLKLNRFKPRDYQLRLFDALENKHYRKILCLWARRAGKDCAAFNLMIRQAVKKVGVYYYIFPTYAQAKKAIWDNITNDGEKMLDYIPPELIVAKNSQEMKIELFNNSLIQFVGSTDFDRLMGTNPQGCIFSEYALQDPRAYQYIRPILTANKGWAIFISTVRGRNHLWELYNIAAHSPEWYCELLTVEDTIHIPLEEIDREIREGIMSYELVRQEYYNDWNLGVEGSYYGRYIDMLRLNNQISDVPWEPAFKVHTAWDLGVRDSTVIIFFQLIGQTIRVIDYYEKQKEGLEHYAKVIQNKPYNYGKHIAPHDIRVREFGSGITRIDKARQLGIRFTIADDVSIVDGIEAVRSTLPKMWIDKSRCEKLIKALENYRQEFDTKKKVYKNKPLHDWACFIGETPILTHRGICQIMDIKKDDLIFTEKGWYPCTGAKITGTNAPLVEVIFDNGMSVKCTPDHNFLTDNGWKSAKNLVRYSKIQSSLIKLPAILMDLYIGYGQMKNILLKAEKDCIELYGKQLLEIFQTIASFITKTVIPIATSYGTLNVFPKNYITNCLELLILDFQTTLEKKQLSGIVLQLEDYGIKDLPSALKAGQNGKELPNYVFGVMNHLWRLLEQVGMNKNSAMNDARHLIIEHVNFLCERADVYCINVPDVHHFSLFNGAIVHNSHAADCMRYLAISLPKVKDGLSSEQIERNYREARYGEQLPAPFNEPGRLEYY